MGRWQTSLLVGAVTYALTVPVPAAPAMACGSPSVGRAFATSVRQRLRCEYRRARGFTSVCNEPATACQGLVDRVVALVMPAGTTIPATTLRAERRCQRALLRLAGKYVTRRVDEFGGFQRRRARAGVLLLANTLERCEGLSTGGSIPAVGDACGTLAAPFDPGPAAHCVRATLEAITQEALGTPLAPNIVLVLTDDQRWDTLEGMPALQQRLRRRGVTFSDAFTSTSLCCPDRASILTGLYAHNHGVRSNAGAFEFDHDRDTIARQLHEHAGYETALVGKYMVRTGAALGTRVPPGWSEWHVFTSDGGFDNPGLYYDYFLNTNGEIARYGVDADGQPIAAEYSTDLLRDRALGLIDRWASRAFFVEYAPFAPHTPAIPADRHRGAFAGLSPARPPNYLEADVSDKPAWVSTYRGLVLLGGIDLLERTDQLRIDQLETLLAVDEAVAAIDDRLEAQGLTDNTMIVYTSDNGLLRLEHWLYLKNYPYEESIRLPLIVRYPRLAPAARTLDALALPIDFYPTFAALAGVAGEPVNGASLVPLLRDDSPPWRDDILIEHFAPVAYVATSHGIRTAQWKLIESDATRGVTTELYDLALDPYELTNVASNPANAGVLVDLRARLALRLVE